jgi:hypothetical protein
MEVSLVSCLTDPFHEICEMPFGKLSKGQKTMMSCTTILPDSEVGVFRLYQPSTYDKFYTRVYGETESRISLDVMLDVESEHHIISMSLTPRRYAGIVAGTTMIHVSPVYIRYVLVLK